jgi:glycosyltransferase involved in cell wall biosynthesis
MQSITAIILTKNEEKNIKNCLKSLSWCDEIIVVDDNSQDKTVEIARKHKAKIFINPLHGDFASQRNFALAKAKSEWVLFIDADEIVPDSLAYEIQNATGSNNFNGFYIKRTDILWGKQLRYGETGNMKLLRLAKKDSGLWEGKIHEKWNIKNPAGILQNPIRHFPHKTLGEFIKEINFYTDIRAHELNEINVRISFCGIFLYPLGKFMVNYVFKRGFMDKIPGLIFATVMSFHSFLVRGKLWILQHD